jgi:hypothetical protein
MTMAMIYQIFNLAISINVVGNQIHLSQRLQKGNFYMLTAKFQTRLNEYVILAVFASCCLYMTLSSLLPHSFIQSEFDLRHTKMFDDIYRVDFLQLHFREMNLFSNACGPFFVNVLCLLFSYNKKDKCIHMMWYLVVLSFFSTVFYCIFFFGRMHKNGIMSKSLFIISLSMYLFVIPLITLSVFFSNLSNMKMFQSTYSLWFYIVAIMQFYPALQTFFEFEGHKKGFLTAWNVERWRYLLSCKTRREIDQLNLEDSILKNNNASSIINPVEAGRYDLPV